MNKAMPTYLKAQIDKFLERQNLSNLTQGKTCNPNSHIFTKEIVSIIINLT